MGMKYDSFKKIMQLKHEALLFRATGTLAPSQVSRWNNVCETYRKLLEVNGVNEALSEIEEKIDFIKNEQERQASEMQNYIATIIAVFGLISIVAAVLQDCRPDAGRIHGNDNSNGMLMCRRGTV